MSQKKLQKSKYGDKMFEKVFISATPISAKTENAITKNHM